MKNDNSGKLSEVISALADYELRSDEKLTESELLDTVCNDADAMVSWQCIHLVRDVLQQDYNTALTPDFTSRLRHAISLEIEHHTDEYLPEENVASVVSLADARHRAGPSASQRREHEDNHGPRHAESRRVARARGWATNTVSQEQPFALWKPIVGLGLAASLAGVAFLSSQLWQSTQLNSGSGAPQVAVNSSDSSIASESMTYSDVPTPPMVASHVDDAGTRWRTEGEVDRNQQIEERLNTLLTNHLEDASMSGVQGLVSYSRIVGYDSVSENSLPDEE